MFTLTVADEYGDEWTTELMTVKYDAFYSDSEVVPYTYFLPRLIQHNETIGKQNRRHVSQTVEDALEALPHNPLGDVTVSEVYSMISILSLDDEFDAFRFATTSYDQTDCGLTDIYDNEPASGRSIVGCGLPLASKYLGINSGNDRNGEQDIRQYVADDQPYIMLVGTGDRYNPLNYDSPIVVEADDGNVDIVPGAGQDHRNVGNSAGDIFSYGYAYYMFPHYNNEDAASTRFPLFADPNELTSSFFSEEYSHIFLFDWDANVADLTSASTDFLAGLSLFVHYDKTAVQTLFRMDYYYANENLLLFENFKAAILATNWATLLGQPGYDSIEGITHEGCTATNVCTNYPDLVRIDDVGSYRVWDELYHGIQKYFLGDGNEGADAELHECSKRGLCDFETGLCTCFAGYAGLDCATVDALALGI